MTHWILQSPFESLSALNRIRELLNRSADELCVELGLSQEQARVAEGWKKDSSSVLKNAIAEMKNREELEAEMNKLREGKSLLRFLGDEQVVAKQQKIKSMLSKLLTRHDFIHQFYSHPRIWLAACVRDAALDASRSSEAEWKTVEEYDDSLSPASSFLLKTDDEAGDRYLQFLKTDWNKIQPDFILNQIDGHRSLRFDLNTKMVSFCESVPLPQEG